MSLEAVNNLLVAELRSYNTGEELAEEIASSVGGTMAELENGEVPIIAWWAEPTPEVFTSWLVTDRVLAMHQRSRAGETFTLTVNLERVRRVACSSREDFTSVMLEIEADQQVVVLDTGNSTASIRSTGYELTAAGPKQIALKAFARKLRRVL